MPHFIDDDPATAESLEAHRQLGQFVPVPRDGELFMFVNRAYQDRFAPADPLSVADYVTGLELLGYRFDVTAECIIRWEPEEAMPEAWTARAHALMTAFGRESLRNAEIAGFVLARDRRVAA